MLGFPDGIRTCLFDLDGVLTKTAKVHAAAWEQMFDDHLKTRSKRRGERFESFDSKEDYDRYVDGNVQVLVHLDVVSLRPEVTVDDTPIVLEGKLLV